ncbi:DUF4197 domain-containing protein [Lautropia dentalis]|uniref:DUF4197 domain-containing protein n=1 Tax=Lautropia dentalis TaxID=2490857 RepID=A0A3R8NTR5_9BURK|nr:DUF4197 domain-containing protein [Lautropia dentalis]RRN45644.1 DUF4197 domain-containing protein [Lautropia dentalis]
MDKKSSTGLRGRIAGALVAASLALGTTGLLVSMPAAALDLSSLTQSDASAGVKAALEKGAETAVASLGKADGFLGNPDVKIPLPSSLQKMEKAAKLMGKQKDFEALQTNMNRAAEAAVVEAKPLLLNAIKGMSVSDAKGILSDGDDSVTKFFREKTSKDMFNKFLPIVTQYTSKLGLAQQYNSLAGQASKLGVIKSDDAKIENYVTNKTMDGLYKMIAAEEKTIRQDPVGTGSAILKKVFAK